MTPGGAAAHPRIRLVVHGLGDAAIVEEARSTILEVLQLHIEDEGWTVALTPSATSGRWDLRIESPGKTHLFSFCASPALVPGFVRHYLTSRVAR